MRSFYIIGLFFILSCTGKNKDEVKKINYNGVQRLKILNTERKDIQLTTFGDSVKVWPIRLIEKSLIGSIDKIFYFGDTVIVADLRYSKLVLAYSKTGVPIYQIGKSGDAPGEYKGLTDVEYNPYTKLIEIYDGASNAIKSYNATDGKYVRTENVPFSFMKFACIDKNTRVYYLNFTASNNSSISNKKTSYNLIIANSQGGIKKFFPYDKNNILPQDVLLANSVFFKTADKIYFAPIYSQFAYEITKDDVIPKFKLGEFSYSDILDYKLRRNEWQKQKRDLKNPFIGDFYITKTGAIFSSIIDENGQIQFLYSTPNSNTASKIGMLNNINSFPIKQKFDQVDNQSVSQVIDLEDMKSLINQYGKSYLDFYNNVSPYVNQYPNSFILLQIFLK